MRELRLEWKKKVMWTSFRGRQTAQTFRPCAAKDRNRFSHVRPNSLLVSVVGHSFYLFCMLCIAASLSFKSLLFVFSLIVIVQVHLSSSMAMARTAMVTGASSGIGVKIAEGLARIPGNALYPSRSHIALSPCPHLTAHLFSAKIQSKYI